MDLPPHYDDFADEPPPYETSSQERQQQQQQQRRLSVEQLATLMLDGCTISSQQFPDRVLYETNSPPCEARTTLFGLQKRIHRESEGSDGTMRSRLVHIYDFTYEALSAGNRNVEIKGKASSKRVFTGVKMVQGLNTSSFKIPGHLKANPSVTNPKGDISWKTERGKLLAVETRAERDDGGKVVVPPRLVLKAVLDEKDLDLLVTCWCARLWKEAEKDLAEPFGWSKFKRIASSKTGLSSRAANAGGFL